MDTSTMRDEKGRWLHGRPKGIKEIKPRVPKVLAPSEYQVLAKTAQEEVIEAGLPSLSEVVKKLAEKAKEGDVPAATVLLKHIAPPIPRSVARGIEDLAHLPADQRIAAIAQRAAAGVIDIESATALTAMARVEIESRVIAPVRAALLALKAGEQAAVVLQKLALALDELPAIEGEAEVYDEGINDDPAAGLV